jgi:hypothetical protein
MKIRESMPAILLCTCLIVTFGLTACGDDEEEEMSQCELALEQFNSQACQNQASAAVEEAQTCAVGCGMNLPCLDDCMESFEDDISACLPGTAFLFDECGICYSDCGGDFVDCLADALNDAGECLNTLTSCVNGC